MQDNLSQTFAALADPTRRNILAQLSKGEANVSDLAKPFLKDMSLPAVTKHLKVLEKAGLITKSREAQWRPCKLNGEAFKDVADWMEEYRMYWEESFDRLDAYLKTVTKKKKVKGKKMATKTKSNEIKITRIYDAPVQVVWDAWTDPEQVAKWWGPRGFTLTTHSKDIRAGGSWKYTMHGPDGVDYPNDIKYFEVEKCAKLVYDHGGNNDQPPLFRVTVLFSEVKGKTKMEMSMALETPEAAEGMRKFIKMAGGNATWDRLAEFVEKEISGKEKFVINRSFDVPLKQMFETWTDPKHLAQWACPAGFKMQFIKGDIKPGGSTFYVMTGDNGVKMYGRAEYLKIEKPDRIVYTQQFCDKNERVTRHPMSPTWPETMLTIVELTEEGPDQTRVTLTWEPYGVTTSEELETFINARGGMTQGWTGSFDKLDEHLLIP